MALKLAVVTAPAPDVGRPIKAKSATLSVLACPVAWFIIWSTTIARALSLATVLTCDRLKLPITSLSSDKLLA